MKKRLKGFKRPRQRTGRAPAAEIGRCFENKYSSTMPCSQSTSAEPVSFCASAHATPDQLVVIHEWQAHRIGRVAAERRKGLICPRLCIRGVSGTPSNSHPCLINSAQRSSSRFESSPYRVLPLLSRSRGAFGSASGAALVESAADSVVVWVCWWHCMVVRFVCAIRVHVCALPLVSSQSSVTV